MNGGSALSWLDRLAILLTVAGIIAAALVQGWREDRARTRDLRDLKRNQGRFGRTLSPRQVAAAKKIARQHPPVVVGPPRSLR